MRRTWITLVLMKRTWQLVKCLWKGRRRNQRWPQQLTGKGVILLKNLKNRTELGRKMVISVLDMLLWHCNWPSLLISIILKSSSEDQITYRHYYHHSQIIKHCLWSYTKDYCIYLSLIFFFPNKHIGTCTFKWYSLHLSNQSC